LTSYTIIYACGGATTTYTNDNGYTKEGDFFHYAIILFNNLIIEDKSWKS